MSPLMTTAVVSTALFFAIATIWEFRDIEARLMKSSSEFAVAAWGNPIAPRDFNQQMRLDATEAAHNSERKISAPRCGARRSIHVNPEAKRRGDFHEPCRGLQEPSFGEAGCVTASDYDVIQDADVDQP
jgi:hypothetical protein